MELTQKQGAFPSSSGMAEIRYRVWSPPDPRAGVQLVHGMAEHSGRYSAFAKALCAAGFSVWAMDLLGHGASAPEEQALGYFGPDEGWKKLRHDINILSKLMRETLPPDAPIFLFGHSMGSFLARAYVERYGEELTGAIFCGTSGSNPATLAGILITRLVIAFKGCTHRSVLIDTVAFGHYNDKYPGKPRTKFDWLNSDPAEVDQYIADPFCGFLFTASGYLDLMQLLRSVNRRAWYHSLPHQLPMLLVAGEEDPVGSYGKGVQQVVRRLRESGKKQTACHIFPNMRHEILLEPGRASVFETIIQWLNRQLEVPEA